MIRPNPQRRQACKKDKQANSPRINGKGLAYITVIYVEFDVFARQMQAHHKTILDGIETIKNIWRKIMSTSKSLKKANDSSRLTFGLRLILAIVIIADILDLMDATITNIAAPSIVHSIGGGESLIKWLGAGYALALGVLLVTGARLGDRYGKRKMFLIGITGFTLASAFCGVALSPAMIIAGRLAQGAFGAMLIPQGMSILIATFSREQFTRAISVFGPVISLSAIIGPIFAGFIIQANIFGLGWRPMFLINIVLGTIGIIAAIIVLPHDKPNPDEKLDVLGTVLLGLAMLGLIYGLTDGSENGWTVFPILSLVVGAAMFIGFALRQRYAANPLIKPALFRNKGFTSGMIVGLAFFAAVNGLAYVISLFFQLVLGLTAFEASLGLCPLAVGIVISSIICRPILNKWGRKIVVTGLIVTLLGALGLWAVVFIKDMESTALLMAPTILIIGLGMGACFSSIYDVALGDVAHDEAGSASGSLSAVQQLAAAIGSAVVTTIFFRLMGTIGNIEAMKWSVIIVAAIVAIGLGLVWLMPKSASSEE
jgi:EmrB/QacA subfamily drug resistance transporter